MGMAMLAQNIGPVSPSLIPRLFQGWLNYLTQNPGPCRPMAAALLGSLGISPVLYSINFSPTAHTKTHNKK